MLKDAREDRILVAEWSGRETEFEIPRRLSNDFVFLRGQPVHGVAVRESGPVHTQAAGEGAVVPAFPNAIAIGSPIAVQDRDFLNRFGLICNIFAAFAMIAFCCMAISLMDSSALRVFDVISLLILAGAAVLFVLATVRSYRMLKLPPDWPILFNRRTPQVTYFKVNLPSLLGFGRAIPVDVITRPWGEAKLRTYKTVLFSGKIHRIVYQMALLWGDPVEPKVLKDVVLIGDLDIVDDGPNLRLWEHIRRYMEEDGPPVRKDDCLRKPPNANPPLQFPRDIQDAAGGAPLSRDELAALIR